MEDHTLLHFTSYGWIVGPNEGEKEFLERIASFSNGDSVSHPAYAYLQSHFGLSPTWVKVTYSDRGLAPWEAGMVTIEDNCLQLQVKKVFQKKKRFLFYSETEIVAHECIHCIRMTFEEPLFEEILAYSTSASSFRRYWGPFFRSSRESLLWMSLLVVTTFSTLFFPALSGLWGGWILLTCYGAFRLIRLQHLFRRCLKTVMALVQSSQEAFKILLCLTDKEIKEFAKLSPSECERAILRNKELSLRGHQIHLLMQFALRSRSNA